jgi:hypothetical protein
VSYRTVLPINNICPRDHDLSVCLVYLYINRNMYMFLRRTFVSPPVIYIHGVSYWLYLFGYLCVHYVRTHVHIIIYVGFCKHICRQFCIYHIHLSFIVSAISLTAYLSVLSILLSFSVCYYLYITYNWHDIFYLFHTSCSNQSNQIKYLFLQQ